MDVFPVKENDLSELLTESAPLEDFEVPVAPEFNEAVEEDSGNGGEKFIPTERFNGLMSKFNKTNEELASERQHTRVLESRLQELEALNIDVSLSKEPNMTDVSNLQTQVEMLTKMLAQQQVANVRNEVLSEYPDIAPFVDLIEAPDPESFKNLAQTLNERVQILKIAGNEGLTPPIQEFNESTIQENPVVDSTPSPVQEVPVYGGGSGSMAPAEGSEDRISEAIKNRDFGAFMRAKTEQTSSELEL